MRETIDVTVRNLSATAKTLTLSESDPNLALSTESLLLPASGTARFSVSLATRGPATAEGDVTISDGTTTFLVPFHYSNGN